MKSVNIRQTLAILLSATVLSCNSIAKEFFGIIDYKPTPYVEVASEPFFYSIGKTLRYGLSISDSEPLLFSGTLFGDDLRFVYDSPDHKKAAIVYGGNLYIAEATKPARLLLKNVDNYAASGIQQGDVFYKYSMLQWDMASKSIYIVRDKKQKQLSKQSFSHDATLVRIDIDTPDKTVDIIQDFASLHYFFVGNDGICFNYAPGDGSVVWKCSQNGKIGLAKSHQSEQIILEDSSVIKGRPFVSYDQGNIYESEIWLSSYGFSLIKASDGTVGFFSNNDRQNPIFKIQAGHNIKGHFVDGIGQTGCKVLPGGRYALLDVHHDNFTGQLLVDRLVGKYRELPANTRIWWNLNSFNYKYFKFDIGEMKRPEFVPSASLRISK